jgi:hypothetical protein
MTTTPEKLPPKETALSGVILRFREGDLDFKVRVALLAANLGREVLLQWEADPITGKVTISAAGEVR